MSLLRPDDTCWRIATARRLAFLIDSEVYYAALREALERAERSIWILGWAFDPRTRLSPDGREGPEDPDEISQILVRLAKANPRLDVRLLIWKSALSINGSPAFLEHRARKAFRGSPVQYREDGRTPFGACHHQKVVVIDGEIAFCGGADLAVNRWDTLGHIDADPRRILPHRARHPPRHDVMLLVEGAAAATLGDLFKARWSRAGGERFAPVPESGRWPGVQTAHLMQTDVAVARTEPALHGDPAVHEVLRLRLACIAAARRTIYLENQYFTSHRVADALAQRLAEPDGPEVVLVLPAQAPSWFDRLTMDPSRVSLLRQLSLADRYGRFRAYSPVTSTGEKIVVHSKVGVFDDHIASVGSANLNNRAEGFDTECDIAIQAGDAAAEFEIAQFRDVLIAHFLGVPEGLFATARKRAGSLIAAIEAMNGAGRLRTLVTRPPGAWERFASRHRLGDPASPADSWRLWKPIRRGSGRGGPDEGGSRGEVSHHD